MQPRHLGGPDVPVEGEGQVDDRELKTLAHPHRHDLNGRRVAVESAVAFSGITLLGTFGSQPVPQRRKSEAFTMGRLLQQLGQMSQVGHVPLAALPREDTFAHTGQPCGLENRGHAAFPGVVGPLTQRLGDVVGERIALKRQLFGGLAEEQRRGGGAYQPAAVWLIERFEQTQPVLGGPGLEHVGVPGVDGGNAGSGEGVPAQPRLLVIGGDHRDVAGREVPLAESRSAGEQSTDIGGQVGHDVFT